MSKLANLYVAAVFAVLGVTVIQATGWGTMGTMGLGGASSWGGGGGSWGVPMYSMASMGGGKWGGMGMGGGKWGGMGGLGYGGFGGGFGGGMGLGGGLGGGGGLLSGLIPLIFLMAILPMLFNGFNDNDGNDHTYYGSGNGY